ncbi:ATP-binding cassette domain-containing protein [Patulibacter minatonensis]|uniref:ATP-binding cassette domain-containing protein n=1 Tax=Patulibacter minatonensis TaxID=298163 RepID=UPI0004BC93E2|nr:ATP-binding cassette domain-containing protein [Patulibacter minatonensis]
MRGDAGPDDVDVVLRSRGSGVDVVLRQPALLIDGDRVPIGRDRLAVDVDPRSGVLTASTGPAGPQTVATVVRGSGRVEIEPVAGAAVRVDGADVSRRTLVGGERIEVAGRVVRYVTDAAEDTMVVPGSTATPVATGSLRLDREVLRIGRDPSCDVLLDHPAVAPVHAEITAGSHGPLLRDRSGPGAGVAVNGGRVRHAYLNVGDELAIGPYRLVFDGEVLHQHGDATSLRLDAEGVSVTVGERTILQPVWLTVRPGEVVAIIGESGAGKSTLMTALCGVRPASGGRITVNGEPLAQRTSDLGFVPQDDIVHRDLTVREALGYAAELRLPQSAPKAQRQQAVEQVIQEVGLEEHAETRIGSLSGGQRKRVSVATELVSRPGLLFLDEPTTGLDSGLERRMMLLLRELADAGRGVMLVTHATRSLHLCDRIAVMGRGGLTCFIGPPADALRFFGVQDADEIYEALDRTPAAEWHSAFVASEHAQSTWDGPSQPGGLGARRRPAALPQFFLFLRRYALLTVRDRRTLTTIALQAPLLAFLTALLFKTGVFVHEGSPKLMRAGQSAQVLFLAVTVVAWLGAIGSSREIVKERAVLRRELAVGGRVGAYLASKLVLLGALMVAQTLAVAAILFVLRPMHEPIGTQAVVIGVLILNGFAALATGLVVSAASRNEDQAGSLIPIILVPQLLFAGAIVSIAQLAAPLKVISGLAFARWAFAGTGSGVDMNERLARDPITRTTNTYGTDFFSISPALSMAILLAFVAALAGVTAWLVNTRGRKDDRA